jgi:hypothetical protein
MTPDQYTLRAALKSSMDQAFLSGTVFAASPDELAAWMGLLSFTRDHRTFDTQEIIRAATINHAQTAHTVRALQKSLEVMDATNAKTQRLVVKLAYIAIGVGVLQALPVIFQLWTWAMKMFGR